MAVEDEVLRMGSEAIGVAADIGVDLDEDFSEDSIEDVEDALDRLSSPDLDPPLSEKGRTLTIQRFGCYLLEVARRAYGGRLLWSAQHQEPMLIIEGATTTVSVVTWGRVKNRLAGDTADHIPFFWDGIEAELKQGPPGRRVLLI